MTDRDMPCEGRIDDALRQIEAAYAELYRKIDDESARDDGDTDESLADELDPLSISTTRIMRIEFSWGGPSDWIEVELEKVDRWFEVTSVVYHYADWFDHAERKLMQQQAPALWRLAEYYGEDPDRFER